MQLLWLWPEYKKNKIVISYNYVNYVFFQKKILPRCDLSILSLSLIKTSYIDLRSNRHKSRIDPTEFTGRPSCTVEPVQSVFKGNVSYMPPHDK